MARNTILKIFFLFLVLFFMIYTSSEVQMVPAVFVFGDSLVDVGNNNYLPISTAKADFPHNGVDFPTEKPTGRFCNGKNAADFIAEKVGLPSSPPYLSLKTNRNNASFITGISFASGGAGILNGSDQALGQSIPLKKQVAYYVTVHDELVQQMGSSAAQQHLSKSIFAIAIGSNDIFDYSGSSDLRKNSTPEQYVNLMATTLKGQLEILYGYGARKFVVIGLGVIGCIPSQRIKNQTEGCNEEISHLSVKYNEALKSVLQELKPELNGMAYSYFETYSHMQYIIQNPATFGFTEVKSACCGLGKLKAKIPCIPISTFCTNRSDHLFWDLYHPTEASARILVDTVFDGPTQYTFPINLRHLIAA